MIDDRTDIILALIGESAGCGEHLDDAHHTEEEEDHPDNLVSLEDISYFLIHRSIGLFNIFLLDDL